MATAAALEEGDEWDECLECLSPPAGRSSPPKGLSAPPSPPPGAAFVAAVRAVAIHHRQIIGPMKLIRRVRTGVGGGGGSLPNDAIAGCPIGAVGRLSAGRASRMEMNSGNEAPGSEIYCARRCLTGLPSGWMGEEGTRGAKCPPTSALVLLVHIALPIPLGLLNGKGPSVAFCRAAGGWRLIINGRRRQIRAAQRHRQKTGSSACLRGNKWADDG